MVEKDCWNRGHLAQRRSSFDNTLGCCKAVIWLIWWITIKGTSVDQVFSAREVILCFVLFTHSAKGIFLFSFFFFLIFRSQKFEAQHWEWLTKGGTGPEPKASDFIFFLTSFLTLYICKFLSSLGRDTSWRYAVPENECSDAHMCWCLRCTSSRLWKMRYKFYLHRHCIALGNKQMTFG